jgi:hypothetical protein
MRARCGKSGRAAVTTGQADTQPDWDQAGSGGGRDGLLNSRSDRATFCCGVVQLDLITKHSDPRYAFASEPGLLQRPLFSHVGDLRVETKRPLLDPRIASGHGRARQRATE